MVRELCDDEEFGPKKMTKKTIKASCRKNKLYLTPHLNDVLYLHYSGYNSIECLEEYVGLKCLWLECNAISCISGLEHQTQLRCLYLHNNLIKRIENLDQCKQLDTLNLSHNHIAKIENCGVDILPVLNTLNISHNYLKTIESIAELRKCDFVSVLDLSHNRLEDIAIVKVLGDMKGLRVLTMVGNPVVNEIPSYRKTMILECKSLTYLDSRPVFDKDRACAEAWKRGGYEEERKENLRWKKEEQRKMRRNINATLRLRHRGDGEPELLKTSSDEELENEDDASCIEKDILDETQYQSNDLAWKEIEDLFHQHTNAMKPSQPAARESDRAEEAAEAFEKIALLSGQSNSSGQKPLVEEITSAEYANLTANKQAAEELPATSTIEVEEIRECAENVETSLPSLEQGTEVDETYMEVGQIRDETAARKEMDGDSIEKLEGESEPTSNAANSDSQPVEVTKQLETDRKKEARIASAEQDDTLNVIIQSKEISITMQPSHGSEDPNQHVAERKPSTTSLDYVTGSDSNSDPTLVTDCDSCVRNSSLAYSSRSDTSDSEDMFDKIVPKKHRKLACSMRPDEGSTSSTDSSCCEEGASVLGSKLDRENTITEFIDEYKRFFRSVDVRDPRCVLKNRHRIVRPQTAKSQRTEPIVYEGVLKAMEQGSNQAKIEQVRQERETDDRSLAKEAVLERLMKGHAEVDMNIEQQMISIGGKEHNFNEYRLEVFRKDQEKLQSLIDRVTAQKEKYNAHIDSIHDQLANIMEDYGQISEKLRKVDNMIQTIGEEVTQEATAETPTIDNVEQMVESTTQDQKPNVAEVDTIIEEDVEADIPEVIEQHSSSDESIPNPLEVTQHVAAQIEVGVTDPAHPNARKPITAPEFDTDPVYRKFIDIQYEIDKLTEDQIFDALSEAARELQAEQELEEAKLLHDAVDEYWNPSGTDIDDFRRCLNLDAHPVVQRFKRFIEAQGTDDTDDTDSEAHVRRLEHAYQKYERRLSNHLFDEYLILSRKASIATTTGGESSAAELELIEIEGGHVLRASASRRTTAWDLRESLGETVPELEESNEGAPEVVEAKPQELEDDESRPEGEQDKAPNEAAEVPDTKGDH
uniref:Dynein axonemal assembly factor 1 homolog n=1 Tax=Anopheles dirus TaxID=7168 RepID=A0A182NUX7_9DIPT